MTWTFDDVRRTWWEGAGRTLLVPAVVGLLTVLGSIQATRGEGGVRPVDAVAVVLLLAGPLALVGRALWAPGVIPVAATAAGTYLALGYGYGPVFLPTIVAVCSAVLRGYRVSAWIMTGVAFVGLLVLHLARTRLALDPASWAIAAAWLPSLATVIAGCAWWRARRERASEARAARVETERRQVSEERLRIARDLHDSLGHHLSMINVQAGVAHTLFDQDPEQARTALAAIKSSSRELLAEMRTTLGVLRGIDEAPARHPTPGLERLHALASENRAAGLEVDLDVDAGLHPGPTIDRAVYRIVQEALTNVRRHAAAGRAEVRVHAVGPVLEIEVLDNGLGASAGGAESASGNGIPGMRERATALGGSLDAGTRPRGGFRVRARLPLPTPSPPSVPSSTVGPVRHPAPVTADGDAS
jgi:signal transduction histidine kinase